MLILRLEPIELREPKEWVQIALVGSWVHPSSGPFSLSRQDLADMVRHFRADPRGRLVCDYEHQSLRGMKAPAAGWFVELELRAEGDELWGRPEWTQSADTHIRAGEYAYLSPTIAFRTKDRVTGAPAGTRLLSVALTNTPFLTELPPVAASEAPTMLQLLLTALALTDTATEAQVIERVEALARGRRRLAEVLGLSETCSDAELDAAATAAVQALTIGRAALSERVSSAEDLAARLREVTTLKGQVAALKADQLVQRAVVERKVVPATEAWFREFAARDLVGATAWLSAAPAVMPAAAPTRSGPSPSPGADLDATELAVCGQLGLKPEDFVKHRNAPEVS